MTVIMLRPGFGSVTDKIPVEIEQQYEDNLRWLAEADKHKLVVGSQARILYSDQVGRVKIAQAFNQAVASGRLKVQRTGWFEFLSAGHHLHTISKFMSIHPSS